MLDFIKQDKDPETGKVMRKVRSFVLREGRLTAGQRNALDSLWPQFGLERADGLLDPQAVFDRDAPRVLEIGYGMGHSLADMAQADPDKDFIGIEVHRPGVGALLMEIQQRGLGNLRSYCDDAVDILELCIPDNSLARVQLYFPDPWHGAEGFTNTAGAGQFSPRPSWRPETKFERRGEKLGHGVWDLLFEKS
jgi:tRNA (guanine-N7-)-methyltransferase